MLSTDLMPCPGPHAMPVMFMWDEPELIAMQSSPATIIHREKKGYDNLKKEKLFMVKIITKLPVPMKESRIWMLLELEISIPSVLGLVLGALICRLEMVTPLQLDMVIWFLWLLICLNPLSTRLLHLSNVSACQQNSHKQVIIVTPLKLEFKKSTIREKSFYIQLVLCMLHPEQVYIYKNFPKK